MRPLEDIEEFYLAGANEYRKAHPIGAYFTVWVEASPISVRVANHLRNHGFKVKIRYDAKPDDDMLGGNFQLLEVHV